jgi:thioredoxin-dependent peroxiredoxin
VEANRAFAEKFSFPYPLLCDTSRDIGMKYGACDDPSQESAKRISYLIGPDQHIAKVWAKVDTKVHASDVLASL